jgi:hypothetical protein
MIAILLLDLQTNKCIALPIFSQFTSLTCLLQSALNPTCLLQVNDFPTHLYLHVSGVWVPNIFKALCNKQVGFKAHVISKSFSSFLIGCVRRPTPRTDKGSSSITNNMITLTDAKWWQRLTWSFGSGEIKKKKRGCILFPIHVKI